MRRKTDGEKGNKGLEATKQEYVSRKADKGPIRDHGTTLERKEVPMKGDKAAKPEGMALQSVPSPQSHWLETFQTLGT